MAVGIADQVIYHAAPRAPASWPHQAGVIPPRAQSFQQRAEVEKLRAAADDDGTAVLGQVLVGMGGVGKTQLAAAYARTAWLDGALDVLVWVTASTRSAVVTGYAQAGVDLCRANPDNPEQAARTFLAWLAPKAGAEPCRWLIVLDDIADPDDLRGLWPPPSPYGRILATTRRRDAALLGDGRRLVEVGLFTKAEAVAYFTASLAAHGRSEPADQLTVLARELGHLPLALAQAAAYLVDTGEDVAVYRSLLADRATALAETAPDVLPDEQTLPLAAAWSLSIDRADALRPTGLARPMLHLAALLDPNGIPQDVLTSQPALTHLAQRRTRTGQNLAEEPDPVSLRDAVRALRVLHRLSLIDHTPGTPHRAVRVHQLIQRATRDALRPTQHDQLARIAADALMAAWPVIERDTDIAQTLRANAVALAAHAEAALYLPDVHALIDRTGESLGANGHFTDAMNHAHYVATTTLHHHGPDHPRILAALGDLAMWRGYTGDAAGAADAFAALVEHKVRVLGPDHPSTLTTRHRLAHWRGEAGNAAGAVDAFEQLLEDRVRILGEDHPRTLAARHGLAYWRGRAGDAAGAVGAFEQLLEDRVRILGEDHPDVLDTRSDLAQQRGRAGDAAGAVVAFEQLLENQIRVLGEDHPGTLATLWNLARQRGRAGDAAGAADAFAALVEHKVRVLGPDHRDTLITRHEAATWQRFAGDAAGAAHALAALLEDQMRVLGRDHLDTLTTRHELANRQGEAGDAAGAAHAFAALLKDMARVLGPFHPRTDTTRRTLHSWQEEARSARLSSNDP
ncbi:tetratricopeptide repeat protein [Streptomyces sp. NPDC002088]|uniref:tetratricopeptide repeat protein n=1 Tax=Streptomyces sp. NPDC002088 TaxID=3154665 RepID=UPI00331E631C